MRPIRPIATAILVAALAGTGCTSHTTNQTTAAASSGPSSVLTTNPTAAPTTPADRRVDWEHDRNHGHPDQRQVCPLPEHGTGGVSGRPCLPRVRSRRTGRR
jgi:hypothetical protein